MWTSEDKWRVTALAMGGVASAYIIAEYFNLVPCVSKKSGKMGQVGSGMTDYVRETGIRLNQTQKDLIAETKERFPMEAKTLVNPEVSALLVNLIKMSNTKKGIEIGVFTGYSTLTMATAFPRDEGRLIALDVTDTYASIGRRYWKINNLDHLIDLRIGPAVISLDNLLIDRDNLESFDFVFIDADKINYDAYYERALKLVRKGGWILFDNMFQEGYVAQTTVPDDRQKDVTAIRSLNQKLKNDTRVSISMLEISDGVTLVVKL